MIHALKSLVLSFDDDNGVSEETFDATSELIRSMLGDKPADVFTRYVDATDGRFYLKQGISVNCWNDMMNAMKWGAS